MPRWAYGFWQSRQRYTTQKELVDVVAEYRKRKIPLDNIVLDWFYWKEDQWGSHEFDKTRFPDPKGMVDEVHKQNAQLMISVWPKFYPATANYKELDTAGFMYRGNIEAGAKDWVGPGYTNSFYDPYSKAARDMYWRQINEASTCSASTPGGWTRPSPTCTPTSTSTPSRRASARPRWARPRTSSTPIHWCIRAAYTKARARPTRKRVFILTRSGFGGMQRNASAVWSGDIASRWDDLYNQIAAGVSVSYSGLPNWTYDIGGFANEARYSTQKPKPEDLAEWRELNLRWFQFGAFAPLFRSHGEYPLREIFNLAPAGSEVFDSLVWYDKLRYRLLPYIYTVAADTYPPRRHDHARPGDGLPGRPRRTQGARPVPVRQGLPRCAGVQVPGAQPRDLSTGRRGLVRLPLGGPARGWRTRRAASRRSHACRCSCGPAPSCPWAPRCSTRPRSRARR